MNLSARLQTIVAAVPENANVIDVATDHGYIAIELAKINPNRKIIASDIAEKPLESGRKNAADLGYTTIDFRLGAGFATLTDADNIDTAIIAGIGGKLMVSILDAYTGIPFNRLVLQANNDVEKVRKWLYEQHYQLLTDESVQDDDYIYTVLVAVYTPETWDELYSKDMEQREYEFYFGPMIQRKNINTWKLHIAEKLKKLHFILTQLEKSKDQTGVETKRATYLRFIAYGEKSLNE